MHSSRMRTVRSSSRRGVSTRHTPGPDTPPGAGTIPPGADPLGPDPPGAGTPREQNHRHL